MTNFIKGLFVATLLMFPSAQAQETPSKVFPQYPLFAKEITPSNSARLTNYDGAAQDMNVFTVDGGDVAVLPAGNPTGETVTFTGLPAGSFVPVLCRQVLSSGTTSATLIGIF